jgi:geranylgeranyl diphosphate synthase type I
MNDPLKSLAQEMIPAVELEMEEVLNLEYNLGNPFYGMMHYHMGWVDEKFDLAGSKAGKRIRPLLCLLCTRTAGGDWQQAVPGGASLELLHNFTLIHDDIQDASPTRRGRPTLWHIWGASLAINSGDAMFALSHVAMSRMLERGIPAETVVHAIRRLDETCIDLTIGQHADMSFEERDDVNVDEYLTMIDGKTAALLSLSTELGALVAGCERETIGHYAAFGRDLGLAFQVRDDILGIWGDESVIGKSSATDIVTRKKSLPVLFGLSKSAELRDLYAQNDNSENFVDRVVNILDSLGARHFSESYEERYANNALSHLEAVKPASNGSADTSAAALQQLTLMLLNRQA